MGKTIFVTSSSIPPFEEYVDLIRGIWDSRWMTNFGTLHCQLEEGLKEYLGCDQLELFVNGHSALEIAIKALGLTGEVITTPYSFISTTHALTMNGIEPVFCDIKPDDYTIDETKIEQLITDRTSAILAVHVYGHPCNVEALQKIADRHGLKVIYDAAHAFGVEINGRPIGTYGDVSMFSFHATKVFNSIEGGALTFRDADLRQTIQQLRNFGIEGPESIVTIGGNAKMNEFAAAMGVANLRYVPQYIAQREQVAKRYHKYLQSVPGLMLMDLEGLARKGVTYNYSYYPVVVDETKAGFTRNQLFDALAESNIHARKYFYPLITKCECYAPRYGISPTPVAEYVADRVLTIPMYAHLAEEDIDTICDVVARCGR